MQHNTEVKAESVRSVSGREAPSEVGKTRSWHKTSVRLLQTHNITYCVACQHLFLQLQISHGHTDRWDCKPISRVLGFNCITEDLYLRQDYIYFAFGCETKIHIKNFFKRSFKIVAGGIGG